MENRDTQSNTRQIFRKKLREGLLDDKEVEIDVAGVPMGVEIMAPPGMEDMTSQITIDVWEPFRQPNQKTQNEN